MHKRQRDHFGPRPNMTSRDWKLIDAIVSRAAYLFPDRKRQDILLDLTCVHLGPCPLRLEALLEADSFNFVHDIVGIERNLNRSTFKLENFFVPRFAEKKRGEAAA